LPSAPPVIAASANRFTPCSGVVRAAMIPRPISATSAMRLSTMREPRKLENAAPSLTASSQSQYPAITGCGTPLQRCAARSATPQPAGSTGSVRAQTLVP
jgi:hypothetical protein